MSWLSAITSKVFASVVTAKKIISSATAKVFSCTATSKKFICTVAAKVFSCTRDTQLRDIDGNIYTTVTIGSQEWIVENFRATRYADGTAITNITDGNLWAADTEGAYCSYNNTAENKTIYGLLYNWYTINGLAYLKKSDVVQTGWRVPTASDYATLLSNATGGALKESGITHWRTPNAGATNTSGFTALPAGYRTHNTGAFGFLTSYGFTWASDNASNGSYLFLDYDSSTGLVLSNGPKASGFSIRLMRNI